VVVFSRDGPGQRDLTGVAKRLVTRLTALQAPLGHRRPSRLSRDAAAQAQPRRSNDFYVDLLTYVLQLRTDSAKVVFVVKHL
jgi:hypothetical protein